MTEDSRTKAAVVTGASTGIGEATVRALTAEGWTVFAVARRAERLAALEAETGAVGIPADITEDDDVSGWLPASPKPGVRTPWSTSRAGRAAPTWWALPTPRTGTGCTASTCSAP